MKRILVGFVEISGYYHHLSNGLRELGYNVDEYYYVDHKFNYSMDHSAPKRIFRSFRKARVQYFDSGEANIIFKIIRYLKYIFYANLFLIYTLIRYDVFILSFGSSIFSLNKELKLLKLFGKTIISNVAHGSEARPPYLSGVKQDEEGNLPSLPDLILMTKAIRTNLDVIEKYSDFVIGAPLTCQFLNKPFINYFSLGLPNPVGRIIDPKSIQRTEFENVRILHSPSNPRVKGTNTIREVIQKLKDLGYPIEYIEVMNQSNHVVLKEIFECDFVIDQLYSDSPLATFATEAAFLGKPAVIGGYGWDELRNWIPQDEFPVSQLCHPDDLFEVVEKLIIDREYRENLGSKSKEFVVSNWENKVVARKFEMLIKGRVPDYWCLNPNDVFYCFGVGLPEEKVLDVMASLFEKYDDNVLGLSGKPYFRENFFSSLYTGEVSEVVQ